MASVAELIELKFFTCETKMRDHLMNLFIPYLKKQQEITDCHSKLIEGKKRVEMKLDQVDFHNKIITVIQKRLDEQTATQQEIGKKINEVFEMTQELLRQQRNRIDSISVEFSQQSQDVTRMSSRIDSFTGALNKCYEDMLHFKDLSSELIQNFKYDIMFE